MLLSNYWPVFSVFADHPQAATGNPSWADYNALSCSGQPAASIGAAESINFAIYWPDRSTFRDVTDNRDGSCYRLMLCRRLRKMRLGTDLAFRILPFALALSSAPWTVAQQSQTVSAVELVRQTVQNEVKPPNDHVKFMFLERKETPRGSQTKLLVETREAMAGIVIAINDRPLNPEQRQSEIARIERFVKNPEELKKKIKDEKEDADRIARIMKALPDAFLYQPDGTEVGKEGLGKSGGELVRLKFRPNPRYNPPSRVELVLTGMEGTLLIDANQHRLARIDGKLVKEVGFGWGILGHLNPGGHFLVDQSDVGYDRWEVTHMDLAFTGKVLFFKSLNIRSDEVYSDFRPVPANLTFAQGVELLKKEEPVVAQNLSHHANQQK